MKKIYLTIATALIGATTAYGQPPAIEYDVEVVVISPETKYADYVGDSISYQFRFKNVGTTSIPAGDTI